MYDTTDYQPDVILADVRPHRLMTLEYLLRREGCGAVDTAQDGESAVRLATFHRPKLVILAANLPEIDGRGAAKAIRRGWALTPEAHDGLIWLISDSRRVSRPTRSIDRCFSDAFEPAKIVAAVRGALSISRPALRLVY